MEVKQIICDVCGRVLGEDDRAVEISLEGVDATFTVELKGGDVCRSCATSLLKLGHYGMLTGKRRLYYHHDGEKIVLR